MKREISAGAVIVRNTRSGRKYLLLKNQKGHWDFPKGHIEKGEYFFGAKKLPELARGLGKGIREFKRASREVTDEIEHMVDAETYPPKRIPPAPSPSPHVDQTSSVPAVPKEAAKPHGS